MSSNLAPAVPGPFFNGGPTLFARKTVMLLISHLLQNEFRFLALVALKPANLIVFLFQHWHCCCCCLLLLCIYFKPLFYISFFAKLI